LVTLQPAWVRRVSRPSQSSEQTSKILFDRHNT
jgi:hypothetical protein